MELGLPEQLSLEPLGNDVGSWDDDAAFAHILEAVGLVDPLEASPPVGTFPSSERAGEASRNNDGDNNEAACVYENNDAGGRGTYRCLVGHGSLCAIAGCCPPPASEDENLWELVADKVGRLYEGARCPRASSKKDFVFLMRNASCPEKRCRENTTVRICLRSPHPISRMRRLHSPPTWQETATATPSQTAWCHANPSPLSDCSCAGAKRLRTVLRQTQEWNSAGARE